MVIPDKVKIGAVTYDIRIADEWPGRAESDGQCFYEKPIGHVIYIGADLTQEAQEATFIHECMHAMNSTIDHAFLDSFAEQMYQLLTDNHMLR